MLRIRVLLTSTLGNPREIITFCKTPKDAERREALYKERYPDDEVFVEEIKGVGEVSVLKPEDEK